MGEAEHIDRETLADVPATATDDGDPSACTVGADSADSGPADLDAEDRDGKPAPLRSGATAGDATRGPADLDAATGTGPPPGASAPRTVPPMGSP